jgi:hypothetical protein
MKNLLMALVALVALTFMSTSCGKSCESCTVDVKLLGQSITSEKLNSKTQCDSAKAASGLALGTGTEVTCN